MSKGMVAGLMFSLLGLWPAGVAGEPVRNSTFASLPVPEWLREPESYYRPVPKRNPFTPVGNLASKKPPEAEGKPGPSFASPLRRAELQELQVAGILWNPKNPDRAVALVELPNGKGYRVRRGDRLGSSGDIVRITPSAILVRKNMGSGKTKDVVLRLDEQ